ncbi:MAG: hypothetical protein L3J97_07385, partial [Thermoplasmata archaeon]|nr:hypothetical protein [Thermoplasmata archaeon]
HRLHLAPYDAPALEVLLSARAKLALRPGSYSPDVIAQIAKSAARAGDARFALEVLSSAAQAAESAGRDEVTPEDVRAAKGSIAPTLTEERLTGLSATALLVLLGLARSLRGSRSNATTEKARQAYAVVAEEHGAKPMSRVTFWRTVKELERDGLVDVEAAAAGQSARLAMNELPASTLELLVEERIQPQRSRKR